jgi:hypothetical protein
MREAVLNGFDGYERSALGVLKSIGNVLLGNKRRRRTAAILTLAAASITGCSSSESVQREHRSVNPVERFIANTGERPVVLAGDCTAKERAQAVYIHGATEKITCGPDQAYIEGREAQTLNPPHK